MANQHHTRANLAKAKSNTSLYGQYGPPSSTIASPDSNRRVSLRGATTYQNNDAPLSSQCKDSVQREPDRSASRKK